jgi:hypothetical protein
MISAAFEKVLHGQDGSNSHDNGASNAPRVEDYAPHHGSPFDRLDNAKAAAFMQAKGPDKPVPSHSIRLSAGPTPAMDVNWTLPDPSGSSFDTAAVPGLDFDGLGDTNMNSLYDLIWPE